MRKVQDFWLPAAGRQAAGSSYFCSGVFGEPAGGHREHSAPNGHLKDVAAPKPMDVGLLGGRWGTLVLGQRSTLLGYPFLFALLLLLQHYYYFEFPDL